MQLATVKNLLVKIPLKWCWKLSFQSVRNSEMDKSSMLLCNDCQGVISKSYPNSLSSFPSSLGDKILPRVSPLLSSYLSPVLTNCQELPPPRATQQALMKPVVPPQRLPEGRFPWNPEPTTQGKGGFSISGSLHWISCLGTWSPGHTK